MSERAATASYFLSYSRADQDFALRLARDVRAKGVALWVDQLDIRPSEHWDRAIERAVRDCSGLIVILSPHSAASDNVADEISFAIDHGKSVLPVMIEHCRLPLRIARMQVIDATGDYDRTLARCIDAICSGEIGADTASVPAQPQGVNDEDAIQAAKADLTLILGPIASILVDKEARKAGSLPDLYTRLAGHIASERDRERFEARRHGSRRSVEPTKTTDPRPTASLPISKGEIDRLASILTHYLGPVATIIARREGAAAMSAADFEHRLASRIPDERERTEFLERLSKA